MAEDQRAQHEELAFEHELLTSANTFAEHWERLGRPTGPGTAAFVLVAARTFVSSPDPLSRDEFLELAAALYDRANEELQRGDLVNANEAPLRPALN